ncbi:MAG: 23S rRNA (adenine(2503)-C(2))-methyltransferase RlmN [Myxococcales bacterium]|nr:23S rRNA (adenine(2503)-C(2))-methyltransferase RlmN [Myxococcales bacterium]
MTVLVSLSRSNHASSMTQRPPTTSPLPDAPALPGFSDQSPERWVAALSDAGLRPQQARNAAKQLSRAWYDDGTAWADCIGELPRAAREVAPNVLGAPAPLTISERVTAEDRTSRLLFRTTSGHLIETVIIPSERGASGGRTTVCVSSQVGCGRRCVFCETGKLGLLRQLSAGEIVEQFRQARQIWEAERGPAPPITNVVFMGMGEPLDNLDAVISAIETLCHDFAFGLSAKRITVSTVGVAPKVEEFLRRTKAHLAVSLNAPDDARRTALMPVNKRCSMAELKTALQAGLTKGRDVLFEYVLFDELNDSLDDAELLRAWLQDVPARLNLIPANPGPDPALRQPTAERVWAFQKYLLDQGVRALVRHPHGRDVGGACGQLAGTHRTQLERLAHTQGPHGR